MPTKFFSTFNSLLHTTKAMSYASCVLTRYYNNITLNYIEMWAITQAQTKPKKINQNCLSELNCSFFLCNKTILW